MAIIRDSGKLKSDKRQSKIVAGEFVLLRVLKNDDDTYWVWTATAAEYDRSHKAFPNQNLLMDTAEKEFRPIAAKIIPKADNRGRPYLEFHDVDDPKALYDAANRLAEKLGLDPTASESPCGRTRPTPAGGRSARHSNGGDNSSWCRERRRRRGRMAIVPTNDEFRVPQAQGLGTPSMDRVHPRTRKRLEDGRRPA